MRCTIALAVLAVSATNAFGQASKPAATNTRYVLVAENIGSGTSHGGVWRMDTVTGEIWRCSISTSGLGCYPVPNITSR